MKSLGVVARITFSRFLKAGLFIGAALLVVAVLFVTRRVIADLSVQVETTSQLLARFCAQASFSAGNPGVRAIVRDVITGVDFPIVITSPKGIPRAWRNLGVHPDSVSETSLDSLESDLAISPVIQARIGRIRAETAELDRKNDPIPMTIAGTSLVTGAVHYGAPPALKQLRWMPYVSMAGALALVAIGLWGLGVIREAEKRTIWVGMAKETAHQLGTPLSSLMGWTELLRARVPTADPSGEVRVPVAELDDTVREMERDIDRLNKVAQRFSRVGSAPVLEVQDVTEVVRSVASYMRRRVPQAGGAVEVRERFEPVPAARINAELIEWTLENLIANSISALDQRPAWVLVTVTHRADRGRIEIAVEDNGRGMSATERRRAFEPGFTTKRRGWGLGLALARRVVEDYHGGKIAIERTAPGQGTRIVVSLAEAAADRAEGSRIPGGPR